MAIERPIPLAQGVEDTTDNEVLFSSHSILMDSGRTLQEEWNLLISDIEQLKESFAAVKQFIANRIPVPYQKGTLTFTKGLWQEPVWGNYSSEFMTIAGTTKAVGAGKYDVTFTLNDPTYVWNDGETGAHTVSWYIQPLEIPIPVQEEPYPVFDGSIKTPTWANITGNEITVVGGFAEKADAGVHRISVKPGSDYCWPDGTTLEKELSWTIQRAIISLPRQTEELHYNSLVQTPTWDANGKTSVSTIIDGDISGTVAKTYEVWFKPTDNAMWEDGTTDMRKAFWTILPKVLELNVVGPTDMTFVFNGERQMPAFINYDPNCMDAYDITIDSHGNVTEDTVLSHRDTGAYVTKFVLKDSIVWNDGSKAPILLSWTITPAIIKIPYLSVDGVTSDIILSYTSENIGPDINDYDSDWVIATSVKGITVNTYTAKFTLKEASNTVWTDGTTQAKTSRWQIIPKLIRVPDVISNVITYNGGLVVHPVIEAYDDKFVAVDGDSAANMHSNYPITFELVDPVNTKWEDGTVESKYSSWSITAQQVEVPIVTNTDFTYNGDFQGPDISTYDSQYIMISGNEEKNVNNYTLTMTLVKSGTIWADTLDSEPKTITWSIAKKRIPVPDITNKDNKIYDGNVQYVTATIYEGENYTLTINDGTYLENEFTGVYVKVKGLLAQNAGNYSVTSSLVDPVNTMWNTGLTDPVITTWSIAKKVFLVPTVTEEIYDYNGKEHVCAFNNYVPDFMTVTGDKAVTAGRHTATFLLKDKTNTMWPDGSTDDKPVFWYIGAVIVDVSTLSVKDADYVWDNTVHTITEANIDGFDPDIMILQGDLTGSKVKRYTTQILLKEDNYVWSDNSDSVLLTWNIAKRVMTIPTIVTANTTYDYTGEPITVTEDRCIFGDIKDKEFIDIKDNTGTTAGDYTLKFRIKPDYVQYCTWTDNTTADQKVSWKINKAVLESWGTNKASVDITGAPGSSVDIPVIRPGDGEVKVYKIDENFSATVIDSTSSNPIIRIQDNNGPVRTTLSVKVEEGTNYLSSTDSNARKSSCPARVNVSVDILTNRPPSDFTPSRIKEIVEQGFASTIWNVGDRIPISLNRFTLSGTGNDYIPADDYDAVILGFDHNKAVENPTAAHTMTVAIMYKHDITTNAIALYDRTVTSPVQNYSGNYYSNVFNALNSSWRNVIISTKKFNGTSSQDCLIFSLAPYEVYGNGGPGKTASSDWINQKRYDYFKTYGLPDRIYPCCAEPVSKTVHVTSRSLGQGDNVTGQTVIAFLNQTGYYYSQTQQEWQPYAYADWCQVPLSYHTVNYSSDIQTGMIPCFTIG